MRAGARGDDPTLAQKQSVGKGGSDFLDVVGHEYDRRSAAGLGEFFEQLEEIATSDRVETGAGFVENQEPGAGHQ